jgi:hypothetical protein
MSKVVAPQLPKKVREVVTQTWQTEANLSVFLALLVLVIFVIPSLGLERSAERLYGNLGTSVILVCGAAVAWRRRAVFIATSCVTVITLAARWVNFLTPNAPFGVWPHLLTIAAIVMLLYIMLSQVFAPGPVTHMRIQGAIAVYLLFGIGWAHAYAIVGSIIPGSFTIPERDLQLPSEWFYYSFVTLTTVGFGDIVPVHRVARALTVGEVLTGQLYLAVLIGRLVGMQISSTPSTTDQGSNQ